jgi:hypothetical protein
MCAIMMVHSTWGIERNGNIKQGTANFVTMARIGECCINEDDRQTGMTVRCHKTGDANRR